MLISGFQDCFEPIWLPLDRTRQALYPFSSLYFMPSNPMSNLEMASSPAEQCTVYMIYTFSTICTTFSRVVSQLLWQSAVRWCLHRNLLTSFIKNFVENQINNPVISSFYLYLLSHNIQYELIRWYLNWPTYSVAGESKLDIDVRWIKCIKNCMNKCLTVVCLKVLWVVTGNVLYKCQSL